MVKVYVELVTMRSSTAVKKVFPRVTELTAVVIDFWCSLEGCLQGYWLAERSRGDQMVLRHGRYQVQAERRGRGFRSFDQQLGTP